tara:strand:+ start:4322 stop:4981 length:660 start_codon:yes stop_codon:yes gene_type:complete
MTVKENLQNNIKKITPERAIFSIPILVSILITIMLLFLVKKPIFQEPFEKRNNIKIMNNKIKKIPEIKLNLKKITEQLNIVKQKQDNLLSITIGTKSFNTFLYKLGEIAQKNNLEITKFKPKDNVKILRENNAPTTNIPNPTDNKINNEEDPILVKNAVKQFIDIEISGNYLDVINFVKESENLENLVIFKDFNFNSKKVKKTTESHLKINLIVYGKYL